MKPNGVGVVAGFASLVASSVDCFLRFFFHDFFPLIRHKTDLSRAIRFALHSRQTKSMDLSANDP